MRTQFVAERLRGVEGSPTLALAAKAKELQQAGKPVIDLTAGEPDFPTPESIKRSGIKAIEENHTKYTPAAGIRPLRAAVATHLSHRVGVPYEPSQVIICCGAKHALYNVLQAVCEPGDDVLVFSPYWVSYLPLVELAGGRPVVVETREADGFQPDPKAVRAALTRRTKAIMLNSPSNPTGMLVDRAHLQGLAEIAQDRQLLVITDEIYDQLVFPPYRAESILEVAPELRDQVMVVNGVSKTYSMTGWRIGYAGGPSEIISAMAVLQSHSTSNPSSISQYAALEAVTGDQREIPSMVRAFQERRDRLVGGLNRLKGLSCVMPQGAFYAWCNVSGLKQPASRVASRWLEEAHVAVVPGEGFGSPDHVRFSFAASLGVIDEALEHLERWVQG